MFSDRTNNSEPEIIRRYDIDVESLPSYTLVSGLPTYDDALEQFRKAGILIQQPSVIKIFENMSSSTIKTPLSESNDIIIGRETPNEIANNSINLHNEEINDNNNFSSAATTISDNISLNSCSCGASNSVSSAGNTSILTTTTSAPSTTQSTTTLSTLASVIELSPEQLKILSQKRLSLQIAFSGNSDGNNISTGLRLPSSVNRNRGKIDLCREVNRNNLLRSYEFPQIHRSTSSLNNLERTILAKRLRNYQHRGSLS